MDGDPWWMQICTEPVGDPIREQDLVTVSLYNECNELMLVCRLARLGHLIQQKLRFLLKPGKYHVTARCGLACRVHVIGYEKKCIQLKIKLIT